MLLAIYSHFVGEIAEAVAERSALLLLQFDVGNDESCAQAQRPLASLSLQLEMVVATGSWRRVLWCWLTEAFAVLTSLGA